MRSNGSDRENVQDEINDRIDRILGSGPWAWYVARDDELLIDLDEYMRQSKRGPWGEVFWRLRLQAAIRSNKLEIAPAGIWLVYSFGEHRFHSIIRLARPMSALQRLVWQFHLGSDSYRAKNDLGRLALGVKAPTLLIAPAPIPNFYRDPDAVCRCTVKHSTEQQLRLGKDACKVWRKYRGTTPYELWGTPAPRQQRAKVHSGCVPIEDILQCDLIKPENDDEQNF